MWLKGRSLKKMGKWSVELGRFHIEYELRTVIKGQVLLTLLLSLRETLELRPTINCLLQLVENIEMAAAGQSNPVQVQLPPKHPLDVYPNAWTLFIDSSSVVTGSRVGIVFRTPEGTVIKQAVRLGFKVSNNEVEYEALIVGMQNAKKLGIQDLVIHCDSQLVAN